MNDFEIPKRRIFKYKFGEYLDGLSKRFSFYSLSEKDRRVEYVDKNPQKIKLLIGSNKGLLYYFNGKLIRLISKSVYGITYFENTYYVLQRTTKSSRILKINLNENSIEKPIENIKILVDGLSVGIHQLDIIGDHLYACDTYNNRILSIRLSGEIIEGIYPSGFLSKNSIKSINYSHYNSIYSDFDKVYLVAHNDSLKSGRSSQIHVFDYNNSWFPIKCEQNIGFSAHNFLIKKSDMYWCDSLNFSLIKNRETVFKLQNQLTRGLAANDDLFILGGSDLAWGKKRFQTNGSLYFLDREFKIINKIEILGCGGISEIRILGKDYSLSNFNTPKILASIIKI